MKNQLLEDIDDSMSRVPVAPVRRVQSVAPPQGTQEHARAVDAPGAQSGVTDAPARQRSGVWRQRAPSAPPRHAAWMPRPAVPPQPPPSPAPAPETPRAPPATAPDIASFASREPDWSIPLQPETPPWTERWGRKALGWTAGLGAAVAIAAGAAWMVHETRVESSLAVVADHTQAPANPAPPAVLAAAPLPEPEAEAVAPPLRLLPAEPVAATSVRATLDDADVAGEATGAAAAQEADDRLDAATASALAAATAAAAPPPAKQAVKQAVKPPVAKRSQERRVAAAPVKARRAEAKKPAPKAAARPAPQPTRERVLARAPVLPTRSVSAEEPDPESPLAETLRMCRAAGYHATACLKRGCEATRFGLVCRG